MDQNPYNVNVNINTPPQQAYPAQPPAQALRTDYSLGKLILLSIVTFGIYSLVFQSRLIKDINLTAASDGKKTKGLLVMILLSAITFGIYGIVWTVMFTQRVENENKRRNTGVQFSVTDWVIYSVLLSWTIVCPFIFLNKQIKAFNAINASYNMYG
jgi:heme/copper-type cytochrome/quinol oxidase subunit 2